MEKETKLFIGIILLIIGFGAIALNALDFLAGWGVIPIWVGGAGIVLALIGALLTKPSKGTGSSA